MHGTFKWTRRLIILASLIGIIACVVLLLNFTSSNPTGRRYASESTLPGTSSQIGGDAERILAKDLDWPFNDQADQGLCICRTANEVSNKRCNQCVSVMVGFAASYRVPDFINPKKFIIEAKAAQTMNSDDFKQVTDLAMAARQMDIPLWLYVNKNAKVSRKYHEVVDSTGGDVVFYFTKPGYEDPTDRWAKIGLVLSASALTGGAALEVYNQRKPRLTHQHQTRAAAAVDDLDAFAHRIRVKSQTVIDKEVPRRNDEDPDI